MPDYLLTDPEGQRFKMTVPDDTGTEGAFETAAARTRQSVRPEGGRKEGAITEWAVGQGEKVKGALEHTLAHPEELPAPGGLGELAAPLGIVARRQAFASPRQIRSHLDELADRVRSGTMTAEEYGRARQRMGLSSDVPEYLRPREIGTRPVNPQTIAELRQQRFPEQQVITRPQRQSGPTEDQARDFLQRRLGYVPAGEPLAWARAYQMPGLQRSTSVREGILGGDRDARGLFERHIAPHQDEKTFVDSYFNGAYSPEIRFKRVDEHSGLGQGLDFDGDLILNGERLGSIHRVIYPGAGYAYNAFLQLEKSAQAGGFTKGLMANQFDLYRKMNLERVDVFASVSLGGYSWAKYGFLPLEQDWRALKGPIGTRLDQMRKVISPEDRDLVNLYLSTPDPRAIWGIADIITPVPHPSLKNPTVGKALLAGQDWRGEFRFDNPAQNTRFNDYVATR